MAAQEDGPLLEAGARAEPGGHRPEARGFLRARSLVPFCAVAGIVLFAAHLARTAAHGEQAPASQLIELEGGEVDKAKEAKKVAKMAKKYRIDSTDCEERWHNMACEKDECYTCGSRIKYMEKKKGHGWMKAVKMVADHFKVECRTQRYNVACKGGHCTSCGDRMLWLIKNRNHSAKEAHKAVGGEFPDACGACAKDPCAHVWDDKSCLLNLTTGKKQCSTCGERITWAETEYGLGRDQAKELVGGEFVKVCGGCQAPVGKEGGYKIVWRDEFDDDGKVDKKKWDHVHKGHGFGNNEKQFYTPRDKNSYVEDGKLKIAARRERYKGMNYTSAKLVSVPSWKYGRFTARVKLARCLSKGTWPAVWMLPEHQEREGSGDYGAWPKSGEMDILEHVGFDRGNMFQTAHTEKFYFKIGTQIGKIRYADPHKWHTFFVDWRPDMLNFGIDNHSVLVFRRHSKTDKAYWPFDKPFYIILNLAVGGSWAGYHGIDAGSFEGDGQVMEVDWVRVEQKAWESEEPEQKSWETRKPGCYFKMPDKSKECGGPFKDWHHDKWGEKNAGAKESEAKCLSRKAGHDKHCKVNGTEWKFVAQV